MSEMCLRHVLAQQRAGHIALVVGLGVAEGGDAFEREFRIDDQRAAGPEKWIAQSGRVLFDSVNWNS